MGLRRVILLAAIVASLNSYAQQPDAKNSFSVSADSLAADTVLAAPAADAEVKQMVDNGISQLVAIQKDNERKQKRGAIIRIALGLGFLGVLIAGLLRRRKKPGNPAAE